MLLSFKFNLQFYNKLVEQLSKKSWEMSGGGAVAPGGLKKPAVCFTFSVMIFYDTVESNLRPSHICLVIIF